MRFSKRFVTALVAASVLGSLLAVRVTAQTSDEVPRTVWGAPDLGGVWDYRSITPLERPEKWADKPVLTEEEAAAFSREQAEWQTSLDDAEGAPVQGNAIHTTVFLDWGTATVADRRSSLVVDPPNGRLPSRTPGAENRPALPAGSFGTDPLEQIEDFSLGDRCLATFGHPVLPLPYNNNVQLFLTEDHLVMFVEMFRTTRLIPIGDRPFGTLRQDRGESRGRWEGETLVVETRNFKYGPSQMARGASRDAVLVERFRRVSPDILEYEFTVDDPATWTTSWTARQTWRKNPAPMFEYACHEGNYGLTNMMRYARHEEAAAEDASAIPQR